jgi:hypothetical protein
VKLDAIALAEELNRRCQCISVDPVRLRASLESGPDTAGVYASILAERPHLFSASPVFLARAQLEHMQAVITAIESVVGSELFRAWALELAPPIAGFDQGPRGAFLGYDFHFGHTGPQLIEINTNAGGALLAGAQQACCHEVVEVLGAAHEAKALGDAFVRMFLEEWRHQRGDRPLRHVAIVDENPTAQYLYPEFLLFQELFRRAGLDASIVDPSAFAHRDGALYMGEQRVDLVYNRLTDFYLRAPANAALREAYAAGEVVVTPNPRVYALYADKRHLTVLSDPARLRAWGFGADVLELLADSIPRTELVLQERADELWRRRRELFFKPIDGFGSRAAYRGDKLTRGTWEQILRRPYVAQQVVPPSERTIVIEGQELPFKLDVRNYVYDGTVQLVAARLYRGQTTNFRTPGGGFAPVFTEAAGL